MPDYEFLQVNIYSDIDGELFAASGRLIINEGWKAVDKELQKKYDKKKSDDDDNPVLPITSEGEMALAMI